MPVEIVALEDVPHIHIVIQRCVDFDFLPEFFGSVLRELERPGRHPLSKGSSWRAGGQPLGGQPFRGWTRAENPLSHPARLLADDASIVA